MGEKTWSKEGSEGQVLRAPNLIRVSAVCKIHNAWQTFV